MNTRSGKQVSQGPNDVQISLSILLAYKDDLSHTDFTSTPLRGSLLDEYSQISKGRFFCQKGLFSW